MQMPARAFIRFVAIRPVGHKRRAVVPVPRLAQGIDDPINATRNVRTGIFRVATHAFDQRSKRLPPPTHPETLAQRMGAVAFEFILAIVSIGCRGKKSVVHVLARGHQPHVPLQPMRLLRWVTHRHQRANDRLTFFGGIDLRLRKVELDRLNHRFATVTRRLLRGRGNFGGNFSLDRQSAIRRGSHVNRAFRAFGVGRCAPVGWRALGIRRLDQALRPNGPTHFGLLRVDLAHPPEIVHGGQGAGKWLLTSHRDIDVLEGDSKIVRQGGKSRQRAKQFRHQRHLQFVSLGVLCVIRIVDL